MGTLREQQGLVLEYIAELRLRGLSIQQIVDRLNHANISGPRGGRWHKSTVHRVVKALAMEKGSAE